MTPRRARPALGTRPVGRVSRSQVKGFLLLLAGIPVYVWMRWRASREESEPLTPEQVLPTEPVPEPTREPVAS